MDNLINIIETNGGKLKRVKELRPLDRYLQYGQQMDSWREVVSVEADPINPGYFKVTTVDLMGVTRLNRRDGCLCYYGVISTRPGEEHEA